MIQVIQSHEKEFKSTPFSGWKDGKFYLVSGGNSIKRVYTAQCKDLPSFAWSKPGAPARQKSGKDAVIKAYEKYIQANSVESGDSAKREFVAACKALTPAEFDELPIRLCGYFNQWSKNA